DQSMSSGGFMLARRCIVRARSAPPRRAAAHSMLAFYARKKRVSVPWSGRGPPGRYESALVTASNVSLTPLNLTQIKLQLVSNIDRTTARPGRHRCAMHPLHQRRHHSFDEMWTGRGERAAQLGDELVRGRRALGGHAHAACERDEVERRSRQAEHVARLGPA